MDDVTVTTTPTDYQLAAVAELAKAAAPAAPQTAQDATEPVAEGEDAVPAAEARDGATEATDEAPEEEAKPAADTKQERLSRAYTALAKQRQKLAARREQFAAETARFAAEREQLVREATEAKAVREAVAAAKSDPLKALEVLGIDYDTLTQAVLSSGRPESADVKAAREEIRALRDEMQRREQAREEAAFTQAARAAEQSTRSELSALSRDEGRYPLASKMDPAEAADAAWQVMEDVYRQSQKILAVADAMTYVEEALSERLSRWGVAPTPPTKGGSGRVNGVGNKPAKPEAAAAPARSTPRTLTNTMAAQPASPPAEMSEAELRKAAATLIRFV